MIYVAYSVESRAIQCSICVSYNSDSRQREEGFMAAAADIIDDVQVQKVATATHATM